jgi:mycothiol synthase
MLVRGAPERAVSYRFRRPTDEDFDAVAELIRRCDLEDYGEAEDPEGWLPTIWKLMDPERDAWVAENEDGAVVAAGIARRRHATRIRVGVSIDPGHRGRGIGERLCELVDEAAARLAAGETDAQVSQEISPSNAAARELLERHGYTWQRRYWKMSIELSAEPAAPDWPDGICLEPFELSQTREVFEVAEEAFQDHWGHVEHDFDEWRAWMIEYEGFDPSLWLLARDGGDIAAFSLCRFRGEEGYVGIIGTLRPWRRRGLAQGLLLESFRQLGARGATRVSLYVDSENPTGATQLYEHAGMTVALESDTFTKNLS